MYFCGKLTSGTGSSDYKLVAFDNALISAGISNYNLLKVSSILPKGCREGQQIGPIEGSALLVAYASIASNIPGDLIASSVAVGIPEKSDQVGVIMECSGHYNAETAEKTAREMVRIAMENHGIPCKEIKSSSAEATVSDDGFSSVISALAMW